LVPAHRWTLLAVAALLVTRRIHAILHPQFYAEDGCVFWLEQYLHGWRALGIPYAGYLHLAPRVIAGIASWFDPAAAPALLCAGAILVHLAVVAWLLSPRIELPAKPLLALATVLVPHTCEVFTNVTNVQWPLALALILLALARDATSAGQRWFDRATLVGVGLTGPFVLFLLPVFALRAWLRGGRESLVLLALCAVVAAVQAAVLVSSGLPVSGHEPDVRLLAAVLSCRLWGTMFAGYRLPVVTESTGMALAGAAASCALVAACLRKGPFRHARVCFATSWLMLAAAVAVKFWGEPQLLATASQGDRYFYLPHVLVLWWLVLEIAVSLAAPRAAPRPRRARVAGLVAAALALAAVATGHRTFVERRRPPMPWASELAPVRAGDPFSIPTLPEGLVIRSPGRATGR
jgi:hypothetical protein